MIIAPYVFDFDEDGRYTTEVAIDWVRTDGIPTVLHPGRILQYTTEDEWQVTTAKSIGADTTWKPIAKATKTIKEAFAAAEPPAPARPGYYELIDPDAAADPFPVVPPRTSLYALQRWIPEHGVAGILWSWAPKDSTEPHYAVVRAEHLRT